VTVEADWVSAIETAISKFGKLDIPVNNAGVSSRSVDDPSSLENWNRIMNINSTGVFLGKKHAVPHMQNAGAGSIVNMSSIMGLVGGESGHPAYNASKGSVRLLTKATAVRYGKDGIRANSVHPGYMPPMLSNIPDEEVRRNRQNLIDATPLKREGERMEVAKAVLFLASDDASFITGAELAVDGGFTAK
jgi:NAD(P)-dependent dehydrogenase (short-subunit alcohol dehydrogenase family)